MEPVKVLIGLFVSLMSCLNIDIQVITGILERIYNFFNDGTIEKKNILL